MEKDEFIARSLRTLQNQINEQEKSLVKLEEQVELLNNRINGFHSYQYGGGVERYEGLQDKVFDLTRRLEEVESSTIKNRLKNLIDWLLGRRN